MSEKWWDMSDDELDDLFREASDKVDVPFESSSFDKLRQKMDVQRKPKPAQGYKKRWLVLLSGLLLMVGVGLVYRFGNDLAENNSTEIVKNENTSKRLDILSSDTIQNKDSKLSKSKKSVNEEDILSLSKEKTLLSVGTKTTKKSKLPLAVNREGKTLLSSQTNKRNLERLPVKTQPTTGAASKEAKRLLSSKTIKENLERLSVETPIIKGKLAKKSELPLSASEQGKTLLFPKKTKENLERLFVETPKTKGIAEEKSDSSLLVNKEGKTLLSVSSPTTKKQNKVVENLYFDSKNNKKQLYRFNNSKNNKDREGKSYQANYQITNQSALPIVENKIEISSSKLPEETINKINFHNVDFLKNKDSKSLLTTIHTELPVYVDSFPRTTKPVKFSKFGLRLVLSPDINSIENMDKGDLGGSFGLLFEYNISKKLVIQTGMVYSSKSYVGSFDDYRNWKDWKGYHPSKPTQVDGGCTDFDIPINLRLNLFQKPKQTWFVSSGVSSYWMMNEIYTYNYAWGLPREVGWNDDSKYYLSVLNFSVGLERQISQRFSLQVEPYLKTPLKNVGRGGVNLYSSGLLFSTKYEF